jgi:cytidine deaminase
MMITTEQAKELAAAALQMRARSYHPYSGFAVGAALLAKSGRVYTGCNIENAAFTPTNCAERTAFFKAVSEGEQDFIAIAVAGGPENAFLPLEECPPCGVCLQVMMEFCDPEHFIVLLARSEEDYASYTLKDLLPRGFGPSNVGEANS